MNFFRLKTLFTASVLTLLFLCAGILQRIPAYAAGPNLIPNSALTTPNPTDPTQPSGWSKGNWGTNQALFVYPVAGVDDAAAINVSLTTRSSGDAKWHTAPIPVSAGERYLYTDRYQATVPTFVTVEYHLATGAVQYQDLQTLPATSTWGLTRSSFLVPANVVAITVFHLINQVGSLTLDAPSLTQEDPSLPPPVDPGNLVGNGSLEMVSPQNAQQPNGWFEGNWGTNQAIFTYPVPGYASEKAASVALTSRTSGDAKWSFTPIVTTTNQTLIFRDLYKSNVATIITADYLLINGTHQYVDLGTAVASTDWRELQVPFTPPAGVQSFTIYHLLNKVGSLTIDSVRISIAPPAPPTDPTNLIVNANLNQASPANPAMPLGWSEGDWGTNQAVFTYPVAGPTAQQKALEVRLTSRTSGDAKWSFDAVPVTPGLIYRYTESYKATVPSIITARYDFANGSSVYNDLMRPDIATNWTQLQVSISPPTGAQRMTIFHLINQVGTLTTSNFSLPRPSASSTSTFPEGMVTLTFDDGYLSGYDVARPILNQAGIKGSFYLVHEYLDGSDPFYMDSTQAILLHRDGHEIGGHSRTHPFLPQLTPTQLRDEVSGSRTDLLALGLTPLDTFVYPYGEYNTAVVQAVKMAGYTGARSVQSGFNDKLTDPFLLVDQHVESNTTPAQVQAWINQAKANNTWLILELHQQDYSGDQYSNTPETLQAIVDSIRASNLKTVTLREGLQLMRD